MRVVWINAKNKERRSANMTEGYAKEYAEYLEKEKGAKNITLSED